MNEQDVHTRAQQWGADFVEHFLRTGHGLQRTLESGEVKVDTVLLSHLRDCWKNNDKQERCEIVRALVDATDLYTTKEFRHYYKNLLMQLDDV